MSSSEGARESRARAATGRHPLDLARIVGSAAVVTLGFFTVRTHYLQPLEGGIYRELALLPSWLTPVSRAVSLLGSAVGIALVAGIALLVRHIRAAAKVVLSGTAAWLAVHFSTVFAEPQVLTVSKVARRGGGFHDVVVRSVFPSDHMAVAAAIGTVITPYLPRYFRLVPLVGVALVAVAQDWTGGHLALGLATGAFIGYAIGSASHLVWGGPHRATSTPVVARALRGAGLSPDSVAPLGGGLFSPRHFEACTESGTQVLVEVVRRGQRKAGLVYRARRLLASLEVEDEPGLSSPSHEVEHEAFVSLLAERAGVRTPPVMSAAEVGHGPALLVRQKIEGRRLNQLRPDQIDDGLLQEIWHQVALLGAARIAHHELTAHNVLVDENNKPWLLDFAFAKAGASDTRLAQDRAEMMITLTSVAGVQRALDSAAAVLDRQDLEASLTYLQPLALPTRIRQQLGQRALLADLSTEMARRLGLSRPSFRPKIRATTILTLVVGGGAVYLLLPQIGTVPRLLTALREANYWWLVLALAAGAFTFPMAAESYMGATRRKLPLGWTTMVQLGSAFTSRLTPAGVGGMGLNLIYLEGRGTPRSEAFGTIALNQAAGIAVHATGFFLAAGFLGTSGILSKVHLPSGWPVLAGVAGALVLAGVFLGTPLGRRRVLRPSVQVGKALLSALRQPRRAVALFGGSAGVTMGNGFALVFSLAAFEPHFSLLSVLAVYVGGAALASAAPTPGNLGAIEATLVAGLTGIGIHSEPAVASVLTFRLLTFWLPILPGLAAFRFLQHRKMV